MDRKQLKAKLKAKGYNGKKMAALIGRSEGSVTKFFNGDSELDFYHIFLLVKEVSDNEEEFVNEMRKVCLSLTNPKNVKASMEFASFREQADILERVIHLSEIGSNDIAKEWGKVYKIHLQYLKKEITATELSDKARYLTIKNEELLFIQKWMDAQGSYMSDNLAHLPGLIREMDQLILSHKDEYIVKSYTTKINLIAGNYHLFNNQLQEAEAAYNKVLNNSPYIQKVAHAYHGLGTLSMYTDYNTSRDYFKKAKQIYKDLNQKGYINNVKNILNILNNLHGEDELFMYDDCVELTMELAHKAIIQNKKCEAEMILRTVKVDTLGKRQRAYYNLYVGMLHDDIDAFYKSIMYFKQYNNPFFALMPCYELYKRGERESAIFAAYGEEFDFNTLSIN